MKRHFFEEPETWAYLRNHCLPQLIAGHQKLRIWTAGCSSGESAYSLAICCAELLGEGFESRLVIYATDRDVQALAAVRAGVYAPASIAHLPAETRGRFFSPLPGGSVKICEALRSVVVCGRHDLIEDPPLSQIDLVWCERFAEDLAVAQQEQLWARFAWSLRRKGFLIFGSNAPAAIPASLFVQVRPSLAIFVPPVRPAPTS